MHASAIGFDVAMARQASDGTKQGFASPALLELDTVVLGKDVLVGVDGLDVVAESLDHRGGR